eukprot:578506-Rhodomonas_salina.3
MGAASAQMGALPAETAGRMPVAHGVEAHEHVGRDHGLARRCKHETQHVSSQHRTTRAHTAGRVSEHAQAGGGAYSG